MFQGARSRVARKLLSGVPPDTLFPLAAASEYPTFQRGHEHEAAACEDISRVLGYTMAKYDRSVVLHNLVHHVDTHHVRGALVECGVWRGGSAAIMALANGRYGRPRPVHLFDAWGDWPDPTEVDGVLYEQARQGTLHKADNDGAEQAACELFETIGVKAAFHKGLFDETVPRSDIGPVAVLRLDGDWYESLVVCLAHLVPLVQPGGFVMIDDYGYSAGARKAVDDHLAGSGTFLHYVDYTVRYWQVAG